MHVTPLLGCLLLAVPTLALAQTPPAVPAPLPPVSPPQDPDRPVKRTPADELRDLHAERERLRREIAYVRERAKNVRQQLASKFGPRTAAHRAIDAGGVTPPTPVGPAPTVPRFARVATNDEIANHPADTLLLVNGNPIPQGVFDELMAHLRSSPDSGDEPTMMQRCWYELIRTEAVAGAFPDSDAAERIAEVLANLEAGKSVTEMAQNIGTVPGAAANGQIEIPRNSPLGLRIEQVAFQTPAGKHSRPIRTASGLVVLQVERVEKGANSQLDKVIASAVLVPYSADPVQMQKASLAVNTRQIDLLARDQKVLDSLPPMFKLPAAPQVVQAPEDSRLQFRMEELNAEIAKLKDATDEASVKRRTALEQEYATTKQRLQALLEGRR